MIPSMKLSPFGIEGSISHVSIIPPVTVGCKTDIVVLRVKIKSSGL